MQQKEDAYAAALFIVLKDHDCREAKRLAFMSMKRLCQREANRRGYLVEDAQTKEGDDYSDNPVQFFMCNRMSKQMKIDLVDAFDKMSFLDFHVKLVDQVSTEQSKFQNFLPLELKSKQVLLIKRRRRRTH